MNKRWRVTLEEEILESGEGLRRRQLFSSVIVPQTAQHLGLCIQELASNVVEQIYKGMEIAHVEEEEDGESEDSDSSGSIN